MAYNADPATWITGWNVSGSNLVIPIASIPKLSSAEAAAGSGAGGDVRKCWYAILDQMFTAYNTKADAGDVPNRMQISKSASVNTDTNIITVTYALTFQTQVTGDDVVTPD